jgi:hypothetical protein
VSKSSDTPRTDRAVIDNWDDHVPSDWVPADVARELERELAALQTKYAVECEQSMMAGTQNSALRLQLRDAEERASKLARELSIAEEHVARGEACIEQLNKAPRPEGGTLPAGGHGGYVPSGITGDGATNRGIIRDAMLWRDLPLLHQMDLMVIFGGAESDGVLLSKLAEWIERKRREPQGKIDG